MHLKLEWYLPEAEFFRWATVHIDGRFVGLAMREPTGWVYSSRGQTTHVRATDGRLLPLIRPLRVAARAVSR